MKNKDFLRRLIILIGSIIVTFTFIYLFVFAGGWKLFESGDAIAIELGVSVVLGALIGIILISIDKVVNNYDKKIADLEKRIEELEKKEE